MSSRSSAGITKHVICWRSLISSTDAEAILIGISKGTFLLSVLRTRYPLFFMLNNIIIRIPDTPPYYLPTGKAFYGTRTIKYGRSLISVFLHSQKTAEYATRTCWRQNYSFRRFLVMDNQEAHISYAVVQLAKEPHAILLTVPLHTSYRLHPLDRCLYGPLKRYYNNSCRSWLLGNLDKRITIYKIAEIFGKDYTRAFTEKYNFRFQNHWYFSI